MKQVSYLNPFGRFCCTIGNLPSSYMESLTYEQQLLWFLKFLDEKVIPAVNTNADAIVELQNYLKNLDLQDEVNNKLDEMAESGQLTDIIAQYLQLAGLLCYNSVNDLKNATNLVTGSFVRTFGYYSYGDGGESIYKVRDIVNTDVVNNYDLIALSDPNLVAEMINGTEINVLKYGAKNDGSEDILDILNYIKSQNKNIYIPSGTYLVSATFKLGDNMTIRGDGIQKTIITVSNERRGATFVGNSVNNITIKDMTIDTDNGSVEGAIWFSGVINGLIDNVEALNGGMTSINISGNTPIIPATQTGKNNIVRNCIVRYQKNFEPGGTSAFIAGNGAINTLFENCCAYDCHADCFDSDHSFGTIFLNCIAEHSDPLNKYGFGFWGEGEQERTDIKYNNCKVKNYNGVGVRDLAHAEIIGCEFDNIHGRSIWVSNPAIIKNCILRDCYNTNSETVGTILIENSADIENCEVYADSYNSTNNLLSIYNASSENNNITSIKNCKFKNGFLQLGYNKRASKFINVENSLFENAQLRFYDSYKTTIINNCNFIFNVNADAINSGRTTHNTITNCNFINTGNDITRYAINCTLQPYNTDISNCTMSGFAGLTSNGTNLYQNDSSSLIPKIPVYNFNVSMQTAGNYYNTPIGPGKNGIAIFNYGRDGAKAIIAFSMTTNANVNGDIQVISKTGKWPSFENLAFTYNAGEKLKVSAPDNNIDMKILVLFFN